MLYFQARRAAELKRAKEEKEQADKDAAMRRVAGETPGSLTFLHQG
jgi:hypothetical protein